jgi:hypothetical protein
VYDDQDLAFVTECSPPLELGRQDGRIHEWLYQVSRTFDGHSRIAIAPLDQVKMSRRMALLEAGAEDRVLVRNQSTMVAFDFEGGKQLKPGESCEVALPLVLKFGKKVIRIQNVVSEGSGSVTPSPELSTVFPSDGGDEQPCLPPIDLPPIAVQDANAISRLLSTVMSVLQTAAHDTDYFQQTVRTMVEVVRFERALVLVRDGGGWKMMASSDGSAGSIDQADPQIRRVIDRACDEKRTTWLEPSERFEDVNSAGGALSAVAAPILDRSGEVFAILCGERHLDSLTPSIRSASPSDATAVEVLASLLSFGLEVAKRERAYTELENQLSQFFTPELAYQLLKHPELLSGRDIEITVFSAISTASRI